MFVISGSSLLQVGLQFAVAQNYRGADVYTADTTKTGAAKAAVANAQYIIDYYASASDYDKLAGYWEAICTLVSYDEAAAEGNYFDTDIDPWQLISVFDEDESTNVVCEGYAKAFMYLCDMTAFSEDVACYTVTGTMNGENHMWNVVEIGGKHYLADITNSDTGTVGEGGGLFLVGAQGSAAEGYSLGDLSYVYDSNTLALWGTGTDSILTLEEKSYIPLPEEGETIGGTCGDALKWEFDDETGTMTISGTGKMNDFLEGELIKTPWGKLNDQIRAVKFEEGVTSIGSGAFANCMNLVAVTVPGNVLSIGDSAFANSGLQSATILDGVVKIDVGAFSGCHGLKKITMPQSLTDIGQAAFSSCEGLTTVAVPEGVTKIDNFTFTHCFGLTSISLPSTITSIGEGAFFNCGSLTSVNIPDGVTTIKRFTFNGCSNLTSVTIPDSVTRIEKRAFWQCNRLTDIVIPDGVTYIATEAFAGCYSLTNISLPDSIQYISDRGFANCGGLKEITLPDGLTRIGVEAFVGCTNLTDVKMPDSVHIIRDNAFKGCTSLTSVEIPEGVKIIQDGAFKSCTGLTSITLPSSLTRVREGAFDGCTSLQKVTYKGTEEAWNQLQIDSGNSDLKNAEIHFEPVSEEPDVTQPSVTEPNFTVPTITVPATAESEAPTEPVEQEGEAGIPWWAILIGAVVFCEGIVILILMKKKKLQDANKMQ